jgi:hypothetical protein
MEDAVKNLGATLEASLGGRLGGQNALKTTHNDLIAKRALERLEQLREQGLNRNLTCHEHDENQPAMTFGHIGKTDKQDFHKCLFLFKVTKSHRLLTITSHIKFWLPANAIAVRRTQLHSCGNSSAESEKHPQPDPCRASALR